MDTIPCPSPEEKTPSIEELDAIWKEVLANQYGIATVTEETEERCE